MPSSAVVFGKLVTFGHLATRRSEKAVAVFPEPNMPWIPMIFQMAIYLARCYWPIKSASFRHFAACGSRHEIERVHGSHIMTSSYIPRKNMIPVNLLYRKEYNRIKQTHEEKLEASAVLNKDKMATIDPFKIN